MAKVLGTLIVLLLAAALANTVRSQNPSSSFDYSFWTERPTTLTYQRDAHFETQTSFLQLTATDGYQAVRNSVGRVLHTAPVLFKDATGAQASFETNFRLRIRPDIAYTTPAEGLAFFIAPVGSTPPDNSSGGNLGIFGVDGSAPNVFAMEVDIFRNEWDTTSDHHIGFDMGSRVSSYSVPVPEGLVGKEVVVSIKYNPNTKVITLSYTIGSETKTTSTGYNLGNLLTDQVQVGLSASTGSFFARHEIATWYFRSDFPPPASTSFSYNFFNERPTTLTLQHDAHYAPDTKFLQLTRTDIYGNPIGGSEGRVMYTNAVMFKDAKGTPASFQTTFDFIIGQSGNNTPAEGLAFFIAPVGSTPPVASWGGNLGVFDTYGLAPNVFAVEFDIYSNDVADPSYHHIGFDFGSRMSTTILEVTDGLVGKLVFATISYNAATKAITVTYNAGSATSTTTSFYDLGNLLTDHVQVGLSASTGYSAARHEILSWSFSSTFAPTATATVGLRQVV